VWRDSVVTFAQLPVAGLFAANYFSQQWVERSKTYVTRVVDRLALARPAGAGSADNVMADVLSDDLADATTALVRDLIALPGQTAKYFNRHLEAMIDELLKHIQPDAKTDVRTYVVDELDKLNRELSRLREVAGAETARRALGARAGGAAPRDRHDAAALRRLRADLRGIAARRVPGQRLRERPAGPRERMLLDLQAVFNAARARFETKEAPRARRPGEQAALRRIAMRNAQAKIKEARAELRDAAQLPRRREIGDTRRSGR